MSRDVNPMVGKCKFSDLIAFEIRNVFGEPKSVIELGCGPGGNLSKFSGAICVGIDPCNQNIEKAQKVVKQGQILLGDHKLLSGFKDNQFDVGFTCSVLDHIENFGPALAQLCRICKNVILFEPIIKDPPRQAKESETNYWETTWYHDYSLWLSGLGLKFSCEAKPLYASDSGPYYHKIVIDSSSFTSASRQVLKPLILINQKYDYNSGLHGCFLQDSVLAGIQPIFYGPNLTGIKKSFVKEYSLKSLTSSVAGEVGANLIVIYRGKSKDFSSDQKFIEDIFEKSDVPVVLIDVDFCFTRGKEDLYSKLANVHFLRHPSDVEFSECSIVKFFPFSVNPGVYSYHKFEGRKRICFSGSLGAKCYDIRRKAIKMVDANLSKLLSPIEQATFYHKHIAALTDNAFPYQYLNAKHFEIPSTGTILFTPGKNGVEKFLYPDSFVIYKEDCSDIFSLWESVLKNLDYWSKMVEIGSNHIHAKHSNKNRWIDFVLQINSILKTKFGSFEIEN